MQYEVPPKALPLDEGAFAYITAYVKEASPIIKILPADLIERNEVTMLMDRTDYFCAAFFPGENKKKLQLAAYGNYPDARIKMALGTNKNWKKMKLGWYSDTRRTSVYVTPKLAFASLWESDPEIPVSSSTINFPEEFDREAPFSCWLEDPGKKINSFMDKINVPLQFPVEKIFASFFIEDGLFRVSLKLKFANTSQARAVTGVINMARLFLSRDLSGDASVKMLLDLFFAKAPVQNDIYVNINPPLLNENSMKLLFNFLFTALN